jgi:hypothetical protein
MVFFGYFVGLPIPNAIYVFDRILSFESVMVLILASTDEFAMNFPCAATAGTIAIQQIQIIARETWILLLDKDLLFFILSCFILSHHIWTRITFGNRVANYQLI